MTAANAQSRIRVFISRDRMRAEVVIPDEHAEAPDILDRCRERLRAAQLPDDDPDILAAIDDLLRQPPEEGARRGVIAEGTPADHGEHGRIIWDVEGARARRKERVDALNQRFDHYDQCPFEFVLKDDVLGVVRPPRQGTDGLDVRGRRLKARTARAAELNVDDTIAIDDDGRIIAAESGILHRRIGGACIRKVLEIDEHVDFSTGNIEFEGDILIRQSVRDRFKVNAAGDVYALGLIEAAHIECRGDLVASGGMAGRHMGILRVGGRLVARYLDSVSAVSEGGVYVTREIINCQLTAAGGVTSPHAALIGGAASVQGRFEIGALGSAMNVPTHILIEPPAPIRTIDRKLKSTLEEMEAERKRCRSIVKRSGRAGDDGVAALDRLAWLDRRQDEVIDRRARLDGRGRDDTHVTLIVHKKIHPGVVISVGPRTFRLRDAVDGPLRILSDVDGRIIIRRDNGDIIPLSAVSTLKVA